MCVKQTEIIELYMCTVHFCVTLHFTIALQCHTVSLAKEQVQPLLGEPN